MIIKKDVPLKFKLLFYFSISLSFIGISTIYLITFENFEELTVKDFWQWIITGFMFGFTSIIRVPYIDDFID